MGVSSIGGDSSLSSTNWLSFLSELSSSKSATQSASSSLTASSTSSTGSSEATEDTSTDFASSIISALDTDGDGVISSSELEAALQSSQDILSSLNDSSAQSRAFEAGQQQPPSPPPSSEETASSIVSDLDADGDGVVSAKESGLSESQFSSLDSDGDGSLTTDELSSQIAAAMPPPPPPPEQQSSTSSSSSSNANGSEYSELLEKLGLNNWSSSNIETLYTSESNAA